MAEFVAPVSTEKSLVEIHVNKDWTVRQRMEVVNKVETEQGIALIGEQKFTYNSAHERVRVIKAYPPKTSSVSIWRILMGVRTIWYFW
jgi:hypothetical protein